MISNRMTSNSTGVKASLDNTNVHTANSDNGICVLCSSPASLVCGRCGDFYCSPGCRRSDWRNHRDVCIAMPLLLTKAEFRASLDNENMPQMCAASKFVEQQQPHSNNDQPIAKGNTQERNNNQQSKEREPQSPPILDLPKESKMPRGEHNNNNQKPQAMQREPQSQPTLDRPKENKMPRGGMQQPADSTQPGQIEIPHLSHVVITALHTSNRIFVRRVDENYNEAYKKVLHTVDEYAQSCRPLAKVPAADEEVVCRHDGTLHRCIVANSKNPQNIALELIDMGTRIFRTLGELRECTRDISKLPRHVMMVHLHNVPVHRKTTESYREFVRRQDGEYVILFKDKKSYRGAFTILKSVKTQESLNSTLEEFLKKYASDDTDCSEKSVQLRPPQPQGKQSPRAKPPSPNDSFEEKRGEKENRGHQAAREETAVKKAPFATANDREDRPVVKVNHEESPKQKPKETAREGAYKKPFEIKLLPRNSTHLEVKIMDDSTLDVGQFGCVTLEDIGTLQNVFQQGQKMNLEHAAPYAPNLNEYVMAKFEGEWYRACVLDMQEPSYLVNYVDFTNTAIVTKNEIRRYPAALNGPCVTSLCVLHDFPANINKLKLIKLKDILQVGQVVTIERVLDYTDDNKVLVSCKLAEDVYQ